MQRQAGRWRTPASPPPGSILPVRFTPRCVQGWFGLPETLDRPSLRHTSLPDAAYGERFRHTPIPGCAKHAGSLGDG
jgi:hypothetical protein